MCLILFAWDEHPEYRLVLAANRDEFYDRPSARICFWEDAPDVLAGRDLQAGGTWLGVNRAGRFTALTNFRDPQSVRTDAPSRGMITLDYLRGEQGPLGYLKTLQAQPQRYNGFNLLTGNHAGMFHYSNISGEIAWLKQGVYGLSNALLDTPWPKVQKGKAALAKMIARANWSAKDLFDLLHDEEPAPDDQLPSTGVPFKWEKALSSLFIRTENYGTVCSSVLLIRRDHQVQLHERRYDPFTGSYRDHQVQFMAGS